MLGWMKHKLESRLPGEISITSDRQMIPPLWQKLKKSYRASWWKWKRRVKSWLKKKSKIRASGPVISRQIDGETVADFIFLGSKITSDGDCSHEIKRWLLLGRKVMTNLEVKWSEVVQLCPTLCDSMDCSLPGSFVHGIFQARILEQVAISFSRRSS